MTEAEAAPQERRRIEWQELTAVMLLSVTAILTAWTGFQASQWGGAMSISFAQASTARIEAARLEGAANRKAAIQVSLFTQWLQAYQNEDDELATVLQNRFPEPLATTFPLWIEERPLLDPDAPATPFEMPTYVIPESVAAAEADDRADAKFAEGLENNQRSDNYTMLTVAFATVLFFGALSGRMHSRGAQWAFLIVGWVVFTAAAVLLVTFPRLV